MPAEPRAKNTCYPTATGCRLGRSSAETRCPASSSGESLFTFLPYCPAAHFCHPRGAWLSLANEARDERDAGDVVARAILREQPRRKRRPLPGFVTITV